MYNKTYKEMTQLIRKFEKKSYTGYKVVYKTIGGRLLSPFTGMKYKVGKIPKIRVSTRLTELANSEFNTNNVSKSIKHRSSPFNNTCYGYTALLTKEGAKELLEDINTYDKTTIIKGSFIIVKMRISGELCEAKMEIDIPHNKGVAGKIIDKIY